MREAKECFSSTPGWPEKTDQVLAEIAKISSKPIRYIIDTHLHPDHTGGNEKIAKLGQTIAGGDVTNLTDDAREGAKVIAHQNVLNRMTAPDGAPARLALWHAAHRYLFWIEEGPVLQ